MSDIAVQRHREISDHCDELLSEFVDRLFGNLSRTDQRNRSREYVTGLLTTPGKKSLRRMAAAVSDSPHTSQALQQFVNVSPWDWRPVRHALAEWVEQRRATTVWGLEVAAIPKRGEHSAGVHRRAAAGTDGGVNCQLGIGLFLASAELCVPVDWRLVLPGRWQSDGAWRAAARIAEDEVTPAEGACALDLVRARTRATRRRGIPVVVDLTRVPHDAMFLSGVAALGTGFVAQISGDTVLHPPAGNRGPVFARQLLRGAPELPESGAGVVAGAPGHGPSRVWTCVVRLAVGTSTGRRRPCRVIVEHPAREHRAPRYFLTDLTYHQPVDVLALADTADRTRATVRRLRDHFGLADFEGRSYPGWHHHMTLMSAAYAFGCLTATGTDSRAA
ncbi:IS701 family transposase [Streptomyces sp. NBC_01618]|uniref:IS701 family transposase n=1 Tax=Streptomyces sp. NBC_01618 TaxID=2975900 RepID=UPI00386E8571|nr:transposase [Streptomyces sp. NBC_01618]